MLLAPIHSVVLEQNLREREKVVLLEMGTGRNLR